MNTIKIEGSEIATAVLAEFNYSSEEIEIRFYNGESEVMLHDLSAVIETDEIHVASFNSMFDQTEDYWLSEKTFDKSLEVISEDALNAYDEHVVEQKGIETSSELAITEVVEHLIERENFDKNTYLTQHCLNKVCNYFIKKQIQIVSDFSLENGVEKYHLSKAQLETYLNDIPQTMIEEVKADIKTVAMNGITESSYEIIEFIEHDISNTTSLKQVEWHLSLETIDLIVDYILTRITWHDEVKKKMDELRVTFDDISIPEVINKVFDFFGSNENYGIAVLMNFKKERKYLERICEVYCDTLDEPRSYNIVDCEVCSNCNTVLLPDDELYGEEILCDACSSICNTCSNYFSNAKMIDSVDDTKICKTCFNSVIEEAEEVAKSNTVQYGFYAKRNENSALEFIKCDSAQSVEDTISNMESNNEIGSFQILDYVKLDDEREKLLKKLTLDAYIHICNRIETEITDKSWSKDEEILYKRVRGFEEIIAMNTFKLNEILKPFKKCVSIYQTSDLYETDDEDDSYYEAPMYEAYIESLDGEEVDDTTTGRYCDIDSVIDEITVEVVLYVQNQNSDPEEAENLKMENKYMLMFLNSLGKSIDKKDRTLAEYNKYFAEWIDSLGYSEDDISSICSGSITEVLNKSVNDKNNKFYEIDASRTVHELDNKMAYYNYQGNHFRLFRSFDDAMRFIKSTKHEDSELNKLIVEEFDSEDELDSYLENIESNSVDVKLETQWENSETAYAKAKINAISGEIYCIMDVDMVSHLKDIEVVSRCVVYEKNKSTMVYDINSSVDETHLVVEFKGLKTIQIHEGFTHLKYYLLSIKEVVDSLDFYTHIPTEVQSIVDIDNYANTCLLNLYDVDNGVFEKGGVQFNNGSFGTVSYKEINEVEYTVLKNTIGDM